LGIEQKAGQVNWQDVNSRCGRKWCDSLLTSYFPWGHGCALFSLAQSRIGSGEIFRRRAAHNGVRTPARIKKINQLGDEMNCCTA